MKTFNLFLLLILTQIGNLAFAQDFCVARRDLIDYSPFIRISSNCNGHEISVTSLFGVKLEQKFERKAKALGYHTIASFKEGVYVLATTDRTNLNINNLCLAAEVHGSDSFRILCESGSTMSVETSCGSDLRQFANRYNYKILQEPTQNTPEYILDSLEHE